MAGDSDGVILSAVYDVGGWTMIILLFLFCTALSFFVSYYAGAIRCVSVSSVKKKTEGGSKTAKKAMKILDDDMKYLRYAKSVCAVCFSAGIIICEYAFMPALSEFLVSVFPDMASATAAAAFLVFWASCLVLSCFGIILPEKIGEHKADTAIIGGVRAFSLICTIFQPIVGISSVLSNIIVRLFGNNTGKGSNQSTEEEILLMVDEGEENGFIEGNTKDMIENVFDFDDTTVREIMTHRKDVVAVKNDAKITDVVETAMKSGKSRIPVYHDDIDDIVGIIHVKDLLKFVSAEPPTEQIGGDIIKEAVFVPESKCCNEMFEYMTAHKTQFAVVVDEFGGTGGIITMEDLVESIVGSIQDEYDNEDEEIRQLSENCFTVDGATSLDEITELTGISFEGDDNDTIAGIMLDRIGHIPKSGEHPSVVINGTHFTVQKVENRRISKVLIVKKRN